MRGETDRPRHASDRVRVAHDVSDLPEDENNGLILTLQDQPIIGGSNQTILENPKLMADYKRDFHKHIQEKLKGAHDPLDDFFRGRILAKYDEHNPEKEGFELDDEGKLALDDKMDFEHMPKEGLYDLEVRKEIQSDYFTADELKSGPVKIKKRSKKSITEIYPDNSEAHLGTGLGSKATRDFSFLRLVDEEEEEQEEMLGKRTQKSGMGTDIEQDRKVKEEKYTNSMREATENMRKSTAFAEIQQKEQEDLFLLQQLMKNNKRLAEEKAKKAAEKIKELTRKPEEPAEQGDFVTLDKIEAPKEKHQDLKSIVAKAKQAEDPFKPLEKKKKLNLAHQASGIASVIDVAMPSERYLERSREPNLIHIEMSKVPESTNKDSVIAGGDEPAEKNDAIVRGLIDEEEAAEDDIGRSTFAALEHIRKRGLLKAKQNNVYVGRRNDEKLHTKNERVGEDNDDDGLKLEYRDKSGRLMNRKQAFRYICWGFHNKRPSKLKMAKMEKKIKAEEQVE